MFSMFISYCMFLWLGSHYSEIRWQYEDNDTRTEIETIEM